MASRTLLITLLPSSDVDSGRWMLGHWGIPFVERPHAPIFHILALRWWGMRKGDFPLLIEDGVMTSTVERLWARFDPLASPGLRLIPDAAAEPALHAEVMELQHRMRWQMGSATVHWSYYHLLRHKAVVWSSLTTGVPWWERAFLTFGFPLIRRAMTRALGLGPSDAERALTGVLEAWDEIDARLADGRRYLCGDRMTLADLAFATSGAPMVLEPRYGGHLPALADCPPEICDVAAALRARPAGAFIARIYADHRPG